MGSLCKLTGRIAITWYTDAAAAGVAASPGISMPPLVLCGSIGAAKVEGFDPVRAIGCDNRYITHGVINPPPTAAGNWGVVRGADERQSDGGGELMRGWRSAGVCPGRSMRSRLVSDFGRVCQCDLLQR